MGEADSVRGTGRDRLGLALGALGALGALARRSRARLGASTRARAGATHRGDLDAGQLLAVAVAALVAALGLELDDP